VSRNEKSDKDIDNLHLQLFCGSELATPTGQLVNSSHKTIRSLMRRLGMIDILLLVRMKSDLRSIEPYDRVANLISRCSNPFP